MPWLENPKLLTGQMLGIVADAATVLGNVASLALMQLLLQRQSNSVYLCWPSCSDDVVLSTSAELRTLSF
jgi:hypothetical protein